MDKRSNILTAIFVIVIIVSVAATFYRYVILQDISYETDEETFQQSLLEE